jgi:hypothetical protein
MSNQDPLFQAAQRAIEEFDSWQAYLRFIGVEQPQNGNFRFGDALASLRREVSRVVHES